MKRAILIVSFLLFVQSTFAQEVPMYEINSNNVLDYYSQIAKDNLRTGSVSVATQIGVNNYIEIFDTAGSRINILQLGDSNTTIYQNLTTYSGIADISIRGSNNYINVEGSNSISDGMIMNINSDDMTVLMRNK